MKFLAIGSAGGDPFGSNITVHYPNWSAMEIDLLYSYHELTRNIYIYSLLGKHQKKISKFLWCVNLCFTIGVVQQGWLQKIVELNWRKPLSLKDRLKIEFQAVSVTRDRAELNSLLRAPSVPTGENPSWLAVNDFEPFTNILEFVFRYLGLSA